MDDETREALEKSIKHWEENVEAAEDGEEISIDIYACALCVRFFHRLNCQGCPIKEATGQRVCKGTPYEDAVEAVEDNDYEAVLTASRAELEFLKSLRPTETQPE